MKLLLDTCSFLWLVTENSKKITPKAETLFLDGRNRVLFSAVSAWEISIKWSIGKLELTSPAHEFLTKQILLNKLTGMTSQKL
jgi:PIN domain nuclease of toxin-antitoxin system